jgi:hypothetical protein
MITITNDFHDTEYKTRKTKEELNSIWIKAGTPYESKTDKTFRHKVWNALCGIEGCTCGGAFGERPSMNWINGN